MRIFIRAILTTLLFIPTALSAHAIPVASEPSSSAVVSRVPETVTIHFSERPDQAGSAISVVGPRGELVSDKKTSLSAPKSLSVPIAATSEGAYIVKWSVVSADDGHFTKGTFAFDVATSGRQVATSRNGDTPTESTEVVMISSQTESLAMTVELFGNGIIWAALVLLIFGARPLFRNGYSEERKNLRRGYSAFMSFGMILVLAGAAIQLFLKSSELSELLGTPFIPALLTYIKTGAGLATGLRFAAVGGAAIVFAAANKKITFSNRITVWEVLIIGLLCVFAFFRAVISHATANPFHPEVSVAVNFLHLIEKDVWAGITLALFLLSLSSRSRTFMAALLPRAYSMLAVDFAAVSITATYIVWLHLKSFDNVFSTQWGSALMNLLVMALLLVLVRTWLTLSHSIANLRNRVTSVGFVGVEAALALLVVFCSSVIIITSPPLSDSGRSLTFIDDGTSVSLRKDVANDGFVLLKTSNGETPFVTVSSLDNSSVSIVVELVKRSEHEFAFPEALLSNVEPVAVSVRIARPGKYDAHGEFTVYPNALEESHGSRSFDQFALTFVVVGGCAFLFAGLLFVSSTKMPVHASVNLSPVSNIAGLLITLLVGGNFVAYVNANSVWNSYKAECISDGNMWHSMLPMKAGKPTSYITREGCMWGMGSYPYMFPERSQYEFYKSLPAAQVTLQSLPAVLVSGKEAALKIALNEEDGTPAKLFVDMEKLLHVVIISADQSVFAHVHPDDHAPLTEQAIADSTFEVPFVFPKAGKYLISVDYAHGVTLAAKQFQITVSGPNPQEAAVKTYEQEGDFGGYHVALSHEVPYSGQVATMKYTILKNGSPVTDLQPYLSAAMHISVVKNDLSKFVHIHGEIHPAGQPLPPVRVKDGQVVHSMAMMTTPSSFGPDVEAHLVFPEPGLYTVWGEFKANGKVIPTAFTVRVE